VKAFWIRVRVWWDCKEQAPHLLRLSFAVRELCFCLLSAVCSCCDGCVSCFPPCLLTSFLSISFFVKRSPFLWIVRFSFLMVFSFLGLHCRGVQVRGGVMAEEAIGCAAFSPPCEMLGVQAAAWHCAYYSSDST
jgi:hypothetical protein